jgi:hypothetical protein
MAINMYAEKSRARSLFHCVLFVFGTVYCSTINAKTTEFEYVTDEQSYQYSVTPTGENYTFKFEKNPGNNASKLKAGYHVLQSVYEDSSINKTYSESYIRERARCFVFDSNFHTYSLCFLPNEFSQKNTDRFWGFTTQVPNWKWLVTRFFLPVLLVYLLVFYVTRRKNS